MDNTTCDYGQCDRPAVTRVNCFYDGRVVEQRPACPRHSGMTPFGVGYDYPYNYTTDDFWKKDS